VPAWSDPTALRSDDYEQVGLLLSGAAHPVAADVRACSGQLPDDDGRRLLAEIVPGPDSRLPLRSRNLHRVKNKARMLRALYERLDRLQYAAPAAETTAVVSPRYVLGGPARGPLASGPGMTGPPCRTHDLGGGVTGPEGCRWRR
jgi:hypothetical protein